MIADKTSWDSTQLMTVTVSNQSFESPNLYLQAAMQITKIERVIFEINVIKVRSLLLVLPTYSTTRQGITYLQNINAYTSSHLITLYFKYFNKILVVCALYKFMI